MNERHMDSISPEMFMVLKWGGKSIWQNVLRVFQGPEGLITDLKYFDKWSQLHADLVPKEKSPQGRILWWQPSGTQCQRKMAPQHGTRHWPRQRQRNLGTGTEGWSLNFQSCRRVIGQKCASQERHFWKWKCPGRQDKTSLHPVGGPTALHSGPRKEIHCISIMRGSPHGFKLCSWYQFSISLGPVRPEKPPIDLNRWNLCYSSACKNLLQHQTM